MELADEKAAHAEAREVLDRVEEGALDVVRVLHQQRGRRALRALVPLSERQLLLLTRALLVTSSDRRAEHSGGHKARRSRLCLRRSVSASVGVVLVTLLCALAAARVRVEGQKRLVVGGVGVCRCPVGVELEFEKLGDACQESQSIAALHGLELVALLLCSSTLSGAATR